MIKEFLPAVEWLESDYDYRDKRENAWRSKPRYNPDGSYVGNDVDQNIYRRGPFQLLDDCICGERLSDICEENNDDPCTHEEHQYTVKCYCFSQLPMTITGLPWTEEDEKAWMERMDYRGNLYRVDRYLRETHSYAYKGLSNDRANNTEWWREEDGTAA